MKIERHERRRRAGPPPSDAPASNSSFLHGYDFALHPTDGEYAPAFSAEFLPPESRPARSSSRRGEGDAERFLREKFGDTERFLRERFGDRYAVGGDVGLSGQLSLVLVDHTRGRVTPLRPVYCNPRLLLANAAEMEAGEPLPVLIDPGNGADTAATARSASSAIPAPPPLPPSSAVKRVDSRPDAAKEQNTSSAGAATNGTQRTSKSGQKDDPAAAHTAVPPPNTCRHQQGKEGATNGRGDASKNRDDSSRSREEASKSRERAKSQEPRKTRESDRSATVAGKENNDPKGKPEAEGSSGRHVEAQVLLKKPGDVAPTGRRRKKSGAAADIQDGLFKNVRHSGDGRDCLSRRDVLS